MASVTPSAAPLFTPDRKFIAPETYDAFFAVVERLETTLDRETAALDAQRHGELAEFSRQKRQGFLELNRILQSVQQAIPSQDVISRLAIFRRKLADNDAMLKRHLKAAQAVTDLIVRVMREHESDGTYSRASAMSPWDIA